MVSKLLGSVALAVLLAGPAFSADDASKARPSDTSSSGASSSQQGAAATGQTAASAAQVADLTGKVEADELMKRKVTTANNENVGEINNLVIDPKNGQITHVVISVGGFLGMGEKHVALPWDEIKWGPDNKVVVSTTKQQLEQAAAYEEQNGSRSRSSDRPPARSTTPPPSAPPSTPPSGQTR